MWEDPANKQGGRWLVSLEKKQRGPELNNCWLEVVKILFYFNIHYLVFFKLKENWINMAARFEINISKFELFIAYLFLKNCQDKFFHFC
jgi:Eukaryotic initiation factor 4E